MTATKTVSDLTPAELADYLQGQCPGELIEGLRVELAQRARAAACALAAPGEFSPLPAECEVCGNCCTRDVCGSDGCTCEAPGLP